MSPLFTAIVVILALLAVMGIVVGVANDAVNFLNSALGSKVAPRRVILWVAAAGILVGTLTSSGMMEVARSGVFYPGQFSFQEIMMLFLGMMLGNVLLLDLYNTLGLPTSTTVSMVFGLLGAAVAAALFRIAGDPGPPCRTSRSSSTRAKPWSSSRRSCCRWRWPSWPERFSCTFRASSSRSATPPSSAAGEPSGAASRWPESSISRCSRG